MADTQHRERPERKRVTATSPDASAARNLRNAGVGCALPTQRHMQTRSTILGKARAAGTALALMIGLGSASALSAQTPAERTSVFFGDSLTAGYGLPDPDTQSYPAVIQR